MRLVSIRRFCVLLACVLAGSCINKELTNDLKCTSSDLAIVLVSQTEASTCKSIDAQLEVKGTGGTAPYNYKIGDGIYQTNPVFTNLGPGTYSIYVKDVKGCIREISVVITAMNSSLAAEFSASPDNQCEAPHLGSISVIPSGGVSPYVVKIDIGVFGSATTFSGLKSGAHIVVVKDGEDCEIILNITVPRGDTGISYLTQIKPILTVACNFPSCHGSGTGARDWTSLSKVQAEAASIKARTGLRTMPIGSGPTLTNQQIQWIACWVDDGAKDN